MNQSAESSGAKASKFTYMPALDGLRAIAVLYVFLFHVRVPGFSGGFVGVDLFLVLSGFLITGLLVQEQERYGRIDLLKFYLRRVLRLLPAFLFMLAIFLLISYFCYPEKRFKLNLQAATLAVTYLTNWREVLGYRQSNWLAHAWSLSLEEQFYLVWPAILIMLFYQYRTRQSMLAAVLRLAVLFAILRLVLIFYNVPYARLYHGLDTRADALLVGCAVALGLSEKFRSALNERRRSIAIVMVLGAIAIYLFPCFVSKTVFRRVLIYGGFSLVAVISALWIIYLVTNKNTIFHRVLEHPLLVHLGRLSYAIYLWHYPIIRMMRESYRWPTILLVAGVATLLCASFSYRFIEMPFLRLKDKIGAARKPKVTGTEKLPENNPSQPKYPEETEHYLQP